MKRSFRDLQLKQLSQRLQTAEPLRSLKRPQAGWLRAIRAALRMPQAYVAARLGVSAPAISQYERGEVEGSITLSTIAKFAEAMDCEFVYAVIPRRSLEEMRLERAREVARRTIGAVAQSMALEDQGLPSAKLEQRIDELAKTILAEHPRSLWEK